MASIYNNMHVAMSRILGRDYNNPLGESAFPLLARLVAENGGASRVLDAGCGRGQSAVWWAVNSMAMIDAFDPAPAMLEEARQRAAAYGVTDRIRFYEASFESFAAGAPYDLVLAHDVLCYSREWRKDAARLTAHLKPNALISLSDYYCEGDCPEVNGVLNAWDIARPPSFHTRAEALRALGFTPLLHVDTTRHYREHWAGMKQVLNTRRVEALALIGAEGVEAFAAQIEAILAAVASGAFGHTWLICARNA